jgi:uncharacterized protein YbbC (DUF1343 family)
MKRGLLLLVLMSLFACGEDSPLGPQALSEKEPEDGKKKGPVSVVVVGLERVVASKGGELKGRKVGLVVHAASVTADGKHAIDVLREQGVEVVRLFTPEHGLRSRAAAGEKVKGGVDPESKLPVVSLYGEKTKPAAADLEGLDALVFDLQDGGVRFYTYVSTLLLCLEAAADAGIELVVLDRPNPLGGVRVEGPARDPKAPTSLVSMAPGPLVHGLTAAEMARFANAQRAKPVKLTIVEMSGWKRPMTWKDTGRTWVPPSPNLRTAEAALAYPGTCLLEATNVTEGRGTEAPFLLVGAPWIPEGRLDLITPVPGFVLAPTTFTPAPDAGAPNPKHAGQECRGLRVQVKDPAAAEPYRLGLSLLALLRKEPGFKWNDGGAGLDRLLGTSRVREALDRGDTVDAILEQDAAALAAYRKERGSALIY